MARRFDKLGVAYRENVSVPKGSKGAGQVVTMMKIALMRMKMMIMMVLNIVMLR